MSQVYKSVATTSLPVRSQPPTITWGPRAAPILVVIPAALNIAVLYVNRNTYTGQLLSWSTSNRGAVQVVIQVISSILAFFWLYSIRTVISLWTRHRLSGSQIKLNTLRLWSALSLATPNWDLPWSKALVALGFFTFTLLPATLWAGALTPSLTEECQNVTIRSQYYTHQLFDQHQRSTSTRVVADKKQFLVQNTTLLSWEVFWYRSKLMGLSPPAPYVPTKQTYSLLFQARHQAPKHLIDATRNGICRIIPIWAVPTVSEAE